MSETDVLACEERLRRAQLAGDVAELDCLLDAALIFAALDGTVVRKEDDLALHRSGALEIARMEVLSRELACFDGTAVVNVVMDAAARIGDTMREDRIRYIRIWHRFEDGWRVIAGSMRIVEGV